MATTLLIALLAGLSGSAHCFGMCGGMAGALGMRARRNSTSRFQGLMRALLYHLGRIGGYASVGAIGGTFGHSAHSALSLTRFEAVLRITAGALTLLIGLRLLTRWNAFVPLERLGARLWIKLQPLSKRASLSNHWFGSLATGLLWGWLPCGLVYSIALMTFTTSNAFEGAVVMVAFGIGTLPMMASASLLLGGAWPKIHQQRWFRTAAATVLLAFGTWTIVATQMPHASHPSSHSEARHH